LFIGILKENPSLKERQMATNQHFYFPFGQKLSKVSQADTSPKKAFVLGVYASAVHARWVDQNGLQKVAALAVATEPSIFWTGEGAEKIISGIKIPEELGRLVLPKNIGMNGPSGRALDDLYLKPLGLSRDDAWLCDLLPESRVNEQQGKAIEEQYTCLVEEHDLSPATIAPFKKRELDSAERRSEILKELEDSQAETLILLGDLPIKWFLRFYADRKFSKLSDFGDADSDYGKSHDLIINGKVFHVIALCHPRQAAGLGRSSTKWGVLHQDWVKTASQLTA
jgi:hypothetical protein